MLCHQANPRLLLDFDADTKKHKRVNDAPMVQRLHDQLISPCLVAVLAMATCCTLCVKASSLLLCIFWAVSCSTHSYPSPHFAYYVFQKFTDSHHQLITTPYTFCLVLLVFFLFVFLTEKQWKLKGETCQLFSHNSCKYL